MRIGSFGQGVLVAALLCVARSAFAGCPAAGQNGCLMPTHVLVDFSPDPGCLSVSQDPNECVCNVGLWIKNSCGQSVSATDFTWDETQPIVANPGAELPDGSEGLVNIQAQAGASAGPQVTTFHLDRGGTQTTLTVKYDLTQYSMGGISCSLHDYKTGSAPFAIPGLLLIGVGIRRRRRRSRRRG